MPATTRGANKQTRLEDVNAGNTSGRSKKATNSSKKRKADNVSQNSIITSKKAKSSQGTAAGDHDENDDVIIINRAPVLELWASCVAQFLHPTVSWETCLSVGGAIATITAISKGRSIGKIDKPDPGEAQKKKEERRKKAEEEDLDGLEVMSFKLNLDKNGQAMVGGKPKKAGEEALMKKYGGSGHYERVKTTFQHALKEWKDQKEALDSRAFSCYEDFRPSVAPGQQGWGRKGRLNLDTVRRVVGNA